MRTIGIVTILLCRSSSVALQPEHQDDHRHLRVAHDYEQGIRASRLPVSVAEAALLERAHVKRRKSVATSALISFSNSQGTYNDETPVVLLGEELPITWEGIFAMLFVCLIASVPVVIGSLDKKPSRTQFLQSAGLLAWLMMCLYLFTQKVEFTSVHFHGHRPLTLVETIYLMAQVLTTVGHGDISPADEWSQAVVGAYVLFTILLIADMVSAVVHVAVVNTRGYYMHKLESYSKEVFTGTEEQLRLKSDLDIGEQDDWLRREAPYLPWPQLMAKLAGFILFVIIGASFYHFYPGEERTWSEGIYMSIITLSTVGFGAVLPLTEAGKVFGAFWMLFGVVSLLSLVGGFTELMLAAKARDLWDLAEEHAELVNLRKNASLKEDGTLVVSKYEFLRFGMLHSKLARREELAKIEQTFESLGPDSDGSLRLESIETAVLVCTRHPTISLS
eukprot:TRINITY_DN66303_c0_g1_i1.p1 TRINITY_DN66303_c0_g1~~TRINITY_DN66303_c0_g1_i1.p1  ORF type:complete len:461 (+),score=82.62 TRINITY_DN66303_c0_g1_i1:43-1383(+)